MILKKWKARMQPKKKKEKEKKKGKLVSGLERQQGRDT